MAKAEQPGCKLSHGNVVFRSRIESETDCEGVWEGGKQSLLSGGARSGLRNRDRDRTACHQILKRGAKLTRDDTCVWAIAPEEPRTACV